MILLQITQVTNATATAKHSKLSIDSEFNVIYTNADCFTNKRDDLLILLNCLVFKPSIIVITEVNSKINNNMLESEFSIPGYNIFSANVGVSDFRGIIIYVNSSLSACQLQLQFVFKECLLLQIKDSGKSVLTVGAFYSGPNSKIDNNNLLMDLLASLINHNSGRLLLVGDFNIKSIDWSICRVVGIKSIAINFLESLRINDYTQHV